VDRRRLRRADLPPFLPPRAAQPRGRHRHPPPRSLGRKVGPGDGRFVLHDAGRRRPGLERDHAAGADVESRLTVAGYRLPVTSGNRPLVTGNPLLDSAPNNPCSSSTTLSNRPTFRADAWPPSGTSTGCTSGIRPSSAG